eukprot:scaffold2284_cov402-Prasinococcus_capsulatus_cf.AAC.5
MAHAPAPRSLAAPTPPLSPQKGPSEAVLGSVWASFGALPSHPRGHLQLAWAHPIPEQGRRGGEEA